MTLRARWSFLALAVLGALTVAGSAFAAFTPRLSASADAESNIAISYSQPGSDDPAQKLEVFFPLDYLYGFSDAVGTAIGTVTAKMNAADQGNASLSLSGSLTVASAAQTVSYAGTTSALSALGPACVGRAATAYWVANLSGGGQTIALPIFVDSLLIADSFSEVYSARLVICLPPGDVPAGTAGRAVAGTKLTDLSIALPGLFSYPEGRTLWRLRATPYTPTRGTANAAGAVESQALVMTPQTVTIKSKAGKGGTAVSGRVTAGTRGLPGVKVQVLSGKRVVGTFTTKSSAGTYRGTVKASGKLTARATFAQRDTSCQFPLFTPLTCVGARTSGFTVTSS